ncbi:TolC family protein [Phaeocystidibacter luteus]|uniref:TolC family protein n=1 Tax=Phaeocystidibacter luteus TaxID=911197 RepID=A0A6N6RHM6_9FLAO|nr:TolC family protein [Phaeocystidibacter luteus]KAB2810247.1 TolC family protein [Phaeocystidibacter luteus]
MRNILALVFVFSTLLSVGQSDTLSLDSVMKWVDDYHPVVRSLTYKMRGAEAKVTSARGAFDPKLAGNFSEKLFEDTEYYRYGEGGLNLPTWLGVDVYAYRSFAQGTYLNPELTQPDDGLWRVGVSVPVGGDLIWDERRAMLRDAQLIVERTEAEQRIAYSDVKFESMMRYLEWAQKEAELQILYEVEQLARERFLLTKRAFLAGDRPEMDTIESRISWYNRKLKVQDAQAAAAQARAKLSAMLWTEENIPLEIPSNYHPDLSSLNFVSPPDSATMYGMLAEQPQVAALTVEVDRALNQRRWTRAQLWPDISVKYNILRGAGADAAWNIPDQYQWGVQVNIPLFLRKARGNAEAADNYYREAELKQQDAVQKAEAELFGMQTMTRTLGNQWLQSLEVYTMSERLLEAERRRFIIGESSVFLVNSRENAMINAAVEWLKIRKEYLLSIERQKRLVAAYWDQ